LVVHGGGSGQLAGGSGTAYVRGPGSVRGRLTVDNAGISGVHKTILPPHGGGAALAGSVDGQLVTDDSLPPTGHWIEIRDPLSGARRGIGRLVEDGDGSSGGEGEEGEGVRVVTTEGLPVPIVPGDRWRSVYAFDEVVVRGNALLESDDPIRGAGEVVISGPVEAQTVFADRLVIAPGGVLTQRLTGTTTPEKLRLDVGELIVQSGGSIDVSGRGYPAGTTYPAHTTGSSTAGGSHLGEGAGGSAPWQTFGSVYSPRENGSGSGNGGRGGGVVEILADRVQVDGAIRASGQDACRGGGGGSVWIRAIEVGGTGSIDANGGLASCGDSAGGGGAVSIDYSVLTPGATVLQAVRARGGATATGGAPGTILVRGGDTAVHGHLIVDNGAVASARKTVLPALGSGLALPGSEENVLVTDRAQPVPDYFVGHWVEITNPAGEPEGRWRVATIEEDGRALTLAGSEANPPRSTRAIAGRACTCSIASPPAPTC
jgi:hypothetical protein